MKTFLLIFFAFILGIPSLLSQNDTIWYDREWQSVAKDSAIYYRPSPKQQDNGFMIVDYYKSGNKQKEGFSLQDNEYAFEGTVTWYYENGNVYQMANYGYGQREGELKSYIDGNQDYVATAFYKDGKIESGDVITYNNDYDFYQKETYTNHKKIKETGFEKNLEDGIRYEMSIGDTLEGAAGVVYYDEKGKKVGTLNFKKKKGDDDRDLYYGTHVGYYYNPMQIKSTTEMDGERIMNQKIYYASGKLREELTWENDHMLLKYFDENGKNIGSVTLKPSAEKTYYNPYGIPMDGQMINFDEKYDHSSQNILSIDTYRNSKIIETKSFYPNGKLKLETHYDLADNITERNSYDENGKPRYKLTYKDGIPYNGTVENPLYNEITTYENGKIIKQIENYKNGKVFKIEENDLTIFYDPSGKEIARLISKMDEYGQNSPYDGDVLQQNGYRIESITTYVEGDRTMQITFDCDNELNAIKKQEVWYDRNETTKMKVYYSNGKLQSETWFDGYSEVKADFYDMQGKLLSHMVYSPQKKGTDYKFFYNSDQVEKITTYGEDENILSEMKYRENYLNYSEPQYFLEYEIDFNGKGTYYGRDGVIIATATFRNGEPWEGKVMDFNESYYTISEYKNGQKNGDEFQYSSDYGTDDRWNMIKKSHYADGQLNGASEEYGSKDRLQKLENYEDGELNGTTITYAPDGSEINRVTYKEGKAMDGIVTFIDDYSGYSTQEMKYYYVAGELQKQETFQQDHLSRLTVYNKTGYDVTKFRADGSKEFLLKVNIEDEIDGKIMFYDTKGHITDTGIFKNGLPVSGVFHIDTSDFDQTYESYYGATDNIANIIFKITETEYIVNAYDSDGNELLKLTEKKLENGTLQVQNLIYPSQLLSGYTQLDSEILIEKSPY